MTKPKKKPTAKKKPVVKKEEAPKVPQKGGYKVCPACGSVQTESKEDLRYRIRHYMCIVCNRSWEVPHRYIDHDLPYEPK